MLLQDVAIKVFSKQEYSDDVIDSFRQEVLFVISTYLLHITIRLNPFSIACILNSNVILIGYLKFPF